MLSPLGPCPQSSGSSSPLCLHPGPFPPFSPLFPISLPTLPSIGWPFTSIMTPGQKSKSSKRDGNLQQLFEGSLPSAAKPSTTKHQKDTSSTPMDTEGSLASQATESASSIQSQCNPTGNLVKDTAATTTTPMDKEATPITIQDCSAMPLHSNHSHTQAPTAASTSSSSPAQSSHTVSATVPASSIATAAKATAITHIILYPCNLLSPPPSQVPAIHLSHIYC